MLKDFFKNFRGDKKFFVLLILILLLIILSYFFKPLLKSYLSDHWNEIEKEKVRTIEVSVKNLFAESEKELLKTSNKLKDSFADTLSSGENSYGSLVKLVNSDEFEEYSIEIVAPNGRLIAWNEKIAIPQEDIFPLNFPAGEVYFYNSSLEIYLSITDTLSFQNDLFYFIISKPVEKQYDLQNPYYNEINFSKELSDKFLTQFNINYTSSAPVPKDVDIEAFELFNNKNHKIAVVSFNKPALNVLLNSADLIFERIQSVLVTLGLIFLAISFRKSFKEIKQRWIRLIVIILFCSLFRAVLFLIGFPSNIIQGSLADPSYFSSAFGGGIVRSPIEFFISNIFVLIICVKSFSYLSDYASKNPHIVKRGGLAFIIILPASLFFFLMLRGLTSALRSVIFDSTLRYFKEPNILPDPPAFMMNLNILMIGLSSVIVLSCLIFITIPYFYSSNRKKLNFRYLLMYIFFQITGLIFIDIQRQPLLTPFLSLIFVTLIFAVVYYAAFLKLNSVYNYVYFTLAASIITISLLNFFNLELEKESLKTTALEMNRPNDNLFRFLITETLTSIDNGGQLSHAFANTNMNYNSIAFLIWSNSSLQKESINSSINIFNNSGELLGSFSAGMETPATGELYESFNLDSLSNITNPVIRENISQNRGGKNILTGIVPFTADSEKIGFVSAAIELNEEDYINSRIPEFLGSKKNYLNDVIDVNQLKIFMFSGGKLSKVFGDIYPSTEEAEPILDTIANRNDAWLTLSLSGETYFTYVLKNNSDHIVNITAVALREKDISWNLFNFFKIFILHILLIAVLFLILFSINIKTFRYSFRIQLLIAFLAISILPVIILAIYNRQVIEERSDSALFEVLDKRSDYVINQVKYLIDTNPQISYEDAFYISAKQSGISFSVYQLTSRIFSSNEEYYSSGLFNSRLNPNAYYNLYYLTYREYLTKERIENYTYNSFYKKVNIAGTDFVIGVNDAFTKVRIVFSIIDIDVFLFGVYSFAALIIIIVSTFLANKISSPIRRLTKATDSVAHGDLNIELQNSERGEMKELFDGFNTMTNELRKNQIEISEMERESAWKEMAKQVAHEIKNPLTPMKLAVQQLVASYKDRKFSGKQEDEKFDSIFEKISSTILNQIENLSLIASEFSRFAKMPSLRLEKLDLLGIISDTVNLFVEEKIKISLDTDLKSAIVEADKTQLRRLFINLVRNSIQASASKINISLNQDTDNYTMLVEDNGKGIPEEFKEKIFETNFTTKEKGMGLGLKLAKRFLEGINGNIILLNSSAEGTTFKLFIPRNSKL